MIAKTFLSRRLLVPGSGKLHPRRKVFGIMPWPTRSRWASSGRAARWFLLVGKQLPVADGEPPRLHFTADQESFIKNRCQLRTDADPDFKHLDDDIDERRR